jgi:peptidylprolyl isomerase
VHCLKAKHGGHNVKRWWLVAAVISLQAAIAVARADDDWRDVDPDNLMLIDVKYGRIAVELFPEFAPKHVERMRALARAHFYDGKTFYRVIDGFVAQGGIGEGDDKKLANWPALKREFDHDPSPNLEFTSLNSPDLYAPEVGHIHGFPAARDSTEKKLWLVHCPGAVAMARDDNPDTGGTEFYVVIGQAPRRLDRNLSVFGRVLEGMQYLQKLNRGDPAVDSGVIKDVDQRDPILKVQIASDMPRKERPRFQVMRTDGPGFTIKKEERRNAVSDFWLHQPPKVLEICSVAIPTRRTPSEATAANSSRH